MKQLLILLILLLVGANIFAQAPDTLWTKLYGDKPGWDGCDKLYGATPTYDGGFAMNGYGSTYGDTIKGDQWVVKIDANGDTLWTAPFGDFDRRDYGRDIIESYDNCLIVAGHGRIADQSEAYRIRLFKADSLGNEIWDKNYVRTDGFSVERVIETSDSGFALVGWTDQKDIFLFRADSLGDSVWAQTYGGVDDDIGYDVCQTDDGGFIIAAGSETYGANSWSIYIVRTDAVGDTLWTRVFDQTVFQVGMAIERTHDGHFLIGGYVTNTTYDSYLIKIQENGDTLWTKTIGQDDGNDVIYGMSATPDNGFLLAGRHFNSSTSKNSMYVAKIDAAGDTTWTYTLVGNTHDEAYAAYWADAGDIYLFGTRAASSACDWRDYWVLALSFPADADDGFAGGLPNKITLSDNYPNPFNPATNIDYFLPSRAHVIIEVFDILGHQIKVLLNETKHAGQYRVTWDGTDERGALVSSGIYFYRLRTNVFAETKKMILLK